MQRLLWRIHELDPSFEVRPGSLVWRPTQSAVAELLHTHRGSLVAELAGDELAEVEDLLSRIMALGRRIEEAVRLASPSLLELYGCAALSAARIVGRPSPGHRRAIDRVA